MVREKKREKGDGTKEKNWREKKGEEMNETEEQLKQKTEKAQRKKEKSTQEKEGSQIKIERRQRRRRRRRTLTHTRTLSTQERKCELLPACKICDLRSSLKSKDLEIYNFQQKINLKHIQDKRVILVSFICLKLIISCRNSKLKILRKTFR